MFQAPCRLSLKKIFKRYPYDYIVYDYLAILERRMYQASV